MTGQKRAVRQGHESEDWKALRDRNLAQSKTLQRLLRAESKPRRQARLRGRG